MLKGLNTPHLLLASSNPMRMIQNLNHLLAQQELAKLLAELDRNVVDLFKLGVSHYNFAAPLPDSEWRQKISRLYYGAYNVRRAVTLKYNGLFSTDASDHQKFDQLPDALLNKQSHMANLSTLRDDRNLADYNHSAAVSDLVINPSDALAFATLFIADSKSYLAQQGVTI
jgi:hypothetical protein